MHDKIDSAADRYFHFQAPTEKDFEQALRAEQAMMSAPLLPKHQANWRYWALAGSRKYQQGAAQGQQKAMKRP